LWKEAFQLVIGDSLKGLREQKNFSHRGIEKRTGLIGVYVSCVENGHTVPALKTLKKFAGALEVPMYSYFMTAKSHPNQMPDAARE
jgi:transcriptional regulator with XRE-family HTH domain